MKSQSIRTHKKSVAKAIYKSVLAAVAAAVLTPATTTTVHADDAVASRVNFLVNLELSDKYLTPRGMIVQNKGLVFQPLALALANVYKGGDALNSVTLVGGFWNCFGSSQLPDNSGNPTSWYEIDPIAGVSVGLFKHLTLDVTYTTFNMQIFNIPFSQHLETKLSLDDSSWLGKFALHPTVSLWKELDNKAVASTDAQPKESYYFDLGVAPSYTFEKIGLKVEAPCRMLMANKDFYGTGAGSASTVGLYELGVKASIPMKFMPEGYGHWSFHAGFKYMDFVDKNLIATQGKSGATLVSCGVTTFF